MASSEIPAFRAAASERIARSPIPTLRRRQGSPLRGLACLATYASPRHRVNPKTRADAGVEQHRVERADEPSIIRRSLEISAFRPWNHRRIQAIINSFLCNRHCLRIQKGQAAAQQLSLIRHLEFSRSVVVY
jgi:hypothetical protein